MNEFDKIYSKYIENYENSELKKSSNTNLFWTMFIIILYILNFIILFLFHNLITVFILIVTVCLGILLTPKLKKKINLDANVYKKEVMEPLLKFKYPTAFYDIDTGLDINEYKKTGFTNPDLYSSKSRLIFNENNKKITVNDIEIIIRDADNNRDRYNYFVSKIILDKSINSTILIKNNSLKRIKSNADKIEFEKYFKIKAENQDNVKNLINDMLMDYLFNKLKENIWGTTLDIAIVDNILYVLYDPRRLCYNTISRNPWTSPYNYKILKNSFESIDSLISMTADLCKIINNNCK